MLFLLKHLKKLPEVEKFMQAQSRPDLVLALKKLAYVRASLSPHL